MLIFRQIVAQVAFSRFAMAIVDDPYVFDGELIVRNFQVAFFFAGQVRFFLLEMNLWVIPITIVIIVFIFFVHFILIIQEKTNVVSACRYMHFS